MSLFGCKHHLGKIIDGYQYCKHCGKAIAVKLAECVHKFETIDKLVKEKTSDDTIVEVCYVLRCEKCGKIEKSIIDIYS